MRALAALLVALAVLPVAAALPTVERTQEAAACSEGFEETGGTVGDRREGSTSHADRYWTACSDVRYGSTVHVKDGDATLVEATPTGTYGAWSFEDESWEEARWSETSCPPGSGSDWCSSGSGAWGYENRWTSSAAAGARASTAWTGETRAEHTRCEDEASYASSADEGLARNETADITTQRYQNAYHARGSCEGGVFLAHAGNEVGVRTSRCSSTDDRASEFDSVHTTTYAPDGDSSRTSEGTGRRSSSFREVCAVGLDEERDAGPARVRAAALWETTRSEECSYTHAWRPGSGSVEGGCVETAEGRTLYDAEADAAGLRLADAEGTGPGPAPVDVPLPRGA